jgi:nucleoside-diphosphate-sugar epimerase
VQVRSENTSQAIPYDLPGGSLNNLVTGGTGFLGSHLIEALAARGESVRALVRPTGKVAHLQSLGVEPAYGDLTDAPSLRAAVRGMERVYHCAALAADWGYGWDAFRAVNVTGTGSLLAAALEAKVSRFVHVSTSDVYGYPDYPADESAPYRRRGWPYGDTKIEAEQLAWTFHREHGLPVTVVRPVSIYGPRSNSFVLEIVALLRSGSLVHIGRRAKPAGLAYVANMVDLLLRAGDSDRSVGQAYNASDGSDISWRQYVERLAAIVGVPNPRRVVPHAPAYLAGWVMERIYAALRIKTRPLLTRMAVELWSTDQGFPIDKARNELGYEPEVDFEEGMRRVEAWLRAVNVV